MNRKVPMDFKEIATAIIIHKYYAESNSHYRYIFHEQLTSISGFHKNSMSSLSCTQPYIQNLCCHLCWQGMKYLTFSKWKYLAAHFISSLTWFQGVAVGQKTY